MSGGRAQRESRAQWGWHRLSDDWADEVVRTAAVSADDLVVEVGAGTGALTRPLVATGARVIAIELHPARAAILRRRFAGESRLKVVRADAADLWLPRRAFRVVANPPFSITTPLLRRLVSNGSRLTSAHLILQRDVSKRLERDGVRGPYIVTVERLLPRSAFSPRPHVDAALLSIRRIRRDSRRQ